jgi:hypothetical protein
MIIVHILNIISCMPLRLLAINKVHSFSLDKSVDFCSGDTNEKFLGKLMGYRLAWREKKPC